MLTEEEKIKLNDTIEQLIGLCKNCTEENKEKIYKAYNLAYEVHSEMRRKSGEPYLFHPLRVAQICIQEMGLGVTSIIAAILHDVIEDSEYTIEDIKNLFGETIAKIIDGLTKVKHVVENSTESTNQQTFKKLLIAMSEDVRVILIKLADRLDNMRTLFALPTYKQQRIIKETLYFYAPLAHKLGLYKIKTELEDLSLKYQLPEVYNKIVEKIEETAPEREKFIDEFCKPIKERLDSINLKYTITGRLKSVYSIYKKMEKKKIPFEEIYDLFAIRIVFETGENENEKAICWQIYSIITDIYKPNPERLRDWISNPKANGYEALHITVMSNVGKWVEIQIRSKRMDEIAEYGYAAHWKYKNDDTETEFDKWIKKIRQIIENEQESLSEFIEEIKLFEDDIYVFTPKGEIRRLPIGSTALDFAFEIHTEIGKKAIGAKVNHKLVELDYKLKNGDQVEIITSETQSPQANWLNFVVTAKAKTAIKKSLREYKKECIEKGKNIFEEKLKELQIPLANNTFRKLFEHFKIFSKEMLFYKIGTGEIKLEEVIKTIKKKRKSKLLRFWKIQIKKTATLFQSKKEVLKKPSINRKQTYQFSSLSEEDDGIKKIRATCCCPLPGDDVIGYLVNDNTIEVHKRNCEEVEKKIANNGHKTIDVIWVSEKKETFLVRINISGIDRLGIIKDIATLISNDMEINIRTIHFDATVGKFSGYIDLYLPNTYDLNALLSHLLKIKGVTQAYKVDNLEYVEKE